MSALPNTESLASWLGRLVRISSVSPDQGGPRALSAGPLGEARLGDAVAQWFQELGGKVETKEVLPGRSNVYGIWPGKTNRWAAVDIHLDTVGVEQMDGDPFSGALHDGRVWGRGAVDTKASLAVILTLLERMRATGATPAMHLLIGVTVDEEVGARGAPAFATWIGRRACPIDEMVVAEPTLCVPYTAHKGVLRMRFEIAGIPAHSSQPHLGRNAISAAAHLVAALEEENARLEQSEGSPPLGVGTLTVTLIEGGRGLNVVPDRCAVTIDRRVVTGERTADIRARLEDLARGACPFPFTVETLIAIEAFHQPADTPFVTRLSELCKAEPATAPFCSNAWAYPGVAKACVILGPGSIAQAHGTVEWVEVSELEKLSGIYARWWGLDL